MRKTMILLLFSFLLAACSDSPVCYYLDATGGDDNNSGLAPDEAWKSLEKLRGVKLLPGNKVINFIPEVVRTTRLHHRLRKFTQFFDLKVICLLLLCDSPCTL